MKIPHDVSVAMHKHADVSRVVLRQALRTLAPRVLRGEMLKEWTPENPSRYFDYIVTEWLIHFRAPRGSFPFRVPVPGQQSLHYFVRWADGTLVDLTAEQFENWENIDYAIAKKASLTYPMTKRAKMLDQFVRTQERLLKDAK